MPIIKEDQIPSGRSPWADASRRFIKNRLAMVSLILFVLVLLGCIFVPLFAGAEKETTQDLALGASPPSGKYWFGTDTLGRDLVTRVFKGGRISLAVGLVATLVALTIGVTYGSVSGYIGGRTDAIMMRIVDILYALPFTVFVILLTVVFGKSLILLFIAIGCVEWLTMARIVRAQVLSAKKLEYVEAARSLGLSTPKILFRHIVPNIIGPVIVYATLTIPAIMLLEAVLSFIGLGTQPPNSSWGVLIQDGADNMESSPWMLAFPSFFFALTLFCLNTVGDGLRDALDVRSSKD